MASKKKLEVLAEFFSFIRRWIKKELHSTLKRQKLKLIAPAAARILQLLRNLQRLIWSNATLEKNFKWQFLCEQETLPYFWNLNLIKTAL